MNELLTIKELAAALPPNLDGRLRSRGYVHAMKKAGFPMPNNQATLVDALTWLALNPNFSWRSVYASENMSLTGGGSKTLSELSDDDT